MIKLSLFAMLILVLISCEESDNIIDPAGIDISIAADTIVFAQIGDFGFAGLPEKYVADLVKSWNPDFILSAGDNNYYEGRFGTIKANITEYYGDYIYNFDAPVEYQCDGKAFRDGINRFFPTPGNHDSNNEDGLLPYYNFFTLPGIERYYKFTWGSATFYSVNSTEMYLNFQRIWLKQQVSESQSVFNIVIVHHPPYSAGEHGNREIMQWDFHGMGIDVVFSGHDHIYNRIEKREEKGTFYVVNGLGGKDTSSCNFNPLSPEKFNSFCYGGNYGAVKATATHNKLVFAFYSISSPLQPIDSVVITK